MPRDPLFAGRSAVPIDYERVFDSLPCPCVLLRSDFTIVAVSDSFLRVTGANRGALVGRSLVDTVPTVLLGACGSASRALEDSLSRVLSTGEADMLPPCAFDFGTPVGAGGRAEVRHLAAVNAPVFGPGGAVESIIFQIEDLTEVVEARKEAREYKLSEGTLPRENESLSRDVDAHAVTRTGVEESEARFRGIANAMPQIVWTAEPEGFVDWYNDWWYEYTGVRRGSRWDDGDSPMHPDDVEPTTRRWAESVASGANYEMEYRFRRKSDGNYRWHLGRAIPAKDEVGAIIKWIGTNTDVHDHKVALGLHEAERESRERFLATLTHDLRTPLTAAHMSAQMIGMIGRSDKEIVRYVAKILNNLGRVDRMIQDMLDANRIRAGEMLHLEIGPCDLSDIAGQTIEELTAIHGDRFGLEQGGRITGYWNVHGIRRVLENLCTNAVKYGEPSGQITVGLEKSDGVVRIKVHNEGPPLSDGERDTLFDQFRRSSSAIASGQSGWGLGLTLVKGTAEAHGGHVAVESKAGDGTTFIVSIPEDSRPFQESKAN